MDPFTKGLLVGICLYIPFSIGVLVTYLLLNRHVEPIIRSGALGGAPFTKKGKLAPKVHTELLEYNRELEREGQNRG